MFRNLVLAFRLSGRMLVVLSLMLCNKIALYLFPPDQHRALFSQVHEQSTSHMDPGDVITFEEWRQAFGSRLAIRQLLSSHMFLLTFAHRWVITGDRMPRVNVARIVGDGAWESCWLHELTTPSRPLVICFGSCGCAPFIRKLSEFVRLAVLYRKTANFVMVFTSEMGDGQTVALARRRTTSSNMADRIAQAKQLIDTGLPFPLLVDLPQNEACGVFQAFPDRLCVVLDDVIHYLSPKVLAGFRVDDVRHWLNAFSQI